MMKKRSKAVLAITAALSAAMLLSACGGAAKNSERAYTEEAAIEYKMEADAMEAPAYAAEDTDRLSNMSAAGTANGGAEGGEVPLSIYGREDVKLIFTADVSLKTKELEAAVSAVEVLTEKLGGYIESSNIHTEYSKNAYITVRVPSANYEQFLTELANDGNNTITSLSRNTVDVGLQYADTEAHIETLRIKQERLQTLLSEATEMSDIIELEGALSDVEYQLNSYSSDLARYDSLIGFSTIYVNISQTGSEAVTVEASFGERIAAAFKNSLTNVKIGFQGFVLFIMLFWPGLLILAAVIVLIVKLKKRSAAKRAEGGNSPAPKKHFLKKKDKKAAEESAESMTANAEDKTE